MIAEHKVKLIAAKQCYDDVSGYVHYVHTMDMKIKKEFWLANMSIWKALGLHTNEKVVERDFSSIFSNIDLFNSPLTAKLDLTLMRMAFKDKVFSSED